MKITQREDGKFAIVGGRVVVAMFGTEAEAQAELALLPKDPAGRARAVQAARRSSWRNGSILMLEHERIREAPCGCRSDVATGVTVAVCGSCGPGSGGGGGWRGGRKEGGTMTRAWRGPMAREALAKGILVSLEVFMPLIYGRRWSAVAQN